MKKLYTKAKFETLLILGVSAVACTGQLGVLGDETGSGSKSGGPGANGSGDGDGDVDIEPSDDPGFKGIHRLNSREYDNTVADLLGTSVQPGDAFLNESGHGFDNVAVSLGMTPSQYTAYFNAATQIAEDVFSTPTLSDAILVCDPAGASDAGCATEIIQSFGQHAFRRPLLDAEVQTYLGVYERAVALELTHEESIQQVVRAFLASAEFLYRMEFDADPDSPVPHDLTAYELASRLSYFLWSTTPDSELFAAAADGSLLEQDVLEQQVDRMLADAKASELVDAFAWQWLGMARLESHAVLSDAYPEWNDQLRDALLGEARFFIDAFVHGGQPWNQFLIADVQYTDPLLDTHYAVPGDRVGFFGLGAFLTVSSFSHRTSPTLRAKWILEDILCEPPPPPPANVTIPDLDGDELANQAAEIENVRARLELHRSDPGCANCHASLDPLGMALEHYDAIGRFRETYENDDPVDPTGALPDGTAFDGLTSLAEYLADDDRFLDCTTEKSLTYALGRGVHDEDEAHLFEIRNRWEDSGDLTYHNLAKAVINSVPFKQRRGGSE